VVFNLVYTLAYPAALRPVATRRRLRRRPARFAVGYLGLGVVDGRPMVYVLLAIYGLFPASAPDGVGKAWVSSLVPDKHRRRAGVLPGPAQRRDLHRSQQRGPPGPATRGTPCPRGQRRRRPRRGRRLGGPGTGSRLTEPCWCLKPRGPSGWAYRDECRRERRRPGVHAGASGRGARRAIRQLFTAAARSLPGRAVFGSVGSYQLTEAHEQIGLSAVLKDPASTGG